MADETPLDAAHRAMTEAPEDEALRLRFYERLADGELFLLLASEPVGDAVEPEVFPVEDGPMVLVFDREDRLSAFLGGPAPYAALPGRAVVAMLAGQGIGLGLNLGVAPSETMLPADAVDWLQGMLAGRPEETQGQVIAVASPGGLPEALLTALDAKLAAAGGLARHAYLVSVTYAPARPGHMLAFIDPAPGAEPALARAVAEALAFSGVEAGELDVAMFNASDPMAARLARQGLRFDLPEVVVEAPVRAAPGSDPEKPPRLR